MSALRLGRPGEPVRLVVEQVPELTPRQEQILHLARAYNGNRSRVARHLGVTVRAVQKSLEYAAEAGANVPPPVSRRGIPNMVKPEHGPRCGATMRSGTCARPSGHGDRSVGHGSGHVSERAWVRYRGPGRLLFR